MKDYFIEAAGTRIRAIEEGEGKPILYIHGNLGSCLWFERCMAIPSWRTLALDMPNFGASGPLPDEPSIDGYADAVADFAAAAGLDRPIIVGHSLGGAVAISLAARMPSLWRGLVLVDSAAPSGLFTPESRHPGIEAMRANRAYLEAGLRAVVPSLERSAENDAYFARLVDEALRMAVPAWIGNAVALGKMDYAARCRAFHAPVLVIRGDNDIIVTEAMARESAEAFPRARLEILEGVGHSVTAEDPARFIGMLSEFASRLD
jgi:pimeloyl-ACP methyl ester carboxylesterase